MAQKIVFGEEDIRKFFREFPRSVTDRIIKSAANEPAWMISRQASRELQSSPIFKNIGTDGGYSKLLKVAGDIRPKNLKRAVAVQPNWSADDVFVKGSSREKWTVWGWANLLMKGRGGGGGSWRTKKGFGAKLGTSKRNYINVSTGTTSGAGDYVHKATERVGGHALEMMTKNLRIKMQGVANRKINNMRKYV